MHELIFLHQPSDTQRQNRWRCERGYRHIARRAWMRMTSRPVSDSSPNPSYLILLWRIIEAISVIRFREGLIQPIRWLF